MSTVKETQYKEPTAKQVFLVFKRSVGKVRLLGMSSKNSKFVCNQCKEIFLGKYTKVKAHTCLKAENDNYLINRKANQFFYGMGWSTDQIAQVLNTKSFYINDNSTVSYPKHFKVLSIDPGIVNASAAIVKMRGDLYLRKMQILESRMLMGVFKSLNNKDLLDKFDTFIREIRQLYTKYQPDLIIIERYQARGFSSHANELVPLMIAAIIQEFKGECLIQIVPPAAWKNKVNKILDLNTAYEEIKEYLTPHQLDAVLIGISTFPEHDPFLILDGDNREKTFRAIAKACWQIEGMR
jgi:hypothetical protein